jgi:hypothetical protein
MFYTGGPRMRSVHALALLAILSSAPARAEIWGEHTYPEAGFAAQFPSEPSIESISYETHGGIAVPATQYRTQEGNTLFTIIVAELANTQADRRDAVDEAVAAWRERGEIKLDVNARINREFGRELVVAENDGSRSTMAIFAVNHKLYELRATVLPPNPEAGSADALRFQQSLRFLGGRNGDGYGPDGPGRRPRRPGRFGPGRFDPGLPPPLPPYIPQGS